MEVRHAFGILAQPRTIGLVGGETLEGDQRKGDVVGALMRHEIADQVAAAFRDDGEPALRIFLELRALEGIELVADEDGDGHGGRSCFLIIASVARQSRNPSAGSLRSQWRRGESTPLPDRDASATIEA